MKRTTLVKIITSSLLVLTLGGLYLNDYLIARQYEFELIAKSDDYIIADGVSSVRFRVLLTKNEEPVVGHTIYFYASNGSLPTSRLVTNELGYITFTYFPYLYVNDDITPLEDVTISLQNESNSYVFMVPAKWEFTMPVEKPDDAQTGVDWENLE